MAFGRHWLEGLGIDAGKIDAIIEEHVSVTEGLKKERDDYKEKAEKLPEVQKELDDLKKSDYKKKYTEEHKAFEDFKSEQAAKVTAAAKDKAVRAYLEGKHIKGKNLEVAIKALSKEIGELELTDGKIADTSALEAQVKGDLSGLVTNAKGEDDDTPPKGGGSPMTKAEILKIADTEERTAAIAQNLDLFE